MKRTAPDFLSSGDGSPSQGPCPDLSLNRAALLLFSSRSKALNLKRQ